jgi:hypothetical protein
MSISSKAASGEEGGDGAMLSRTRWLPPPPLKEEEEEEEDS